MISSRADRDAFVLTHACASSHPRGRFATKGAAHGHTPTRVVRGFQSRDVVSVTTRVPDLEVGVDETRHSRRERPRLQRGVIGAVLVGTPLGTLEPRRGRGRRGGRRDGVARDFASTIFRRRLRRGDDDANAFRRRLEKRERAHFGRAESSGDSTTTRLGLVVRVFGARRRFRSQRESTELAETFAKRLRRRNLPRERFHVVDVADPGSVLHETVFVSAEVASAVHRLPRVVVFLVLLVLLVLAAREVREPGAEEIFPSGASSRAPRSTTPRGRPATASSASAKSPAVYAGEGAIRSVTSRSDASSSTSRVDAEARTRTGTTSLCEPSGSIFAGMVNP